MSASADPWLDRWLALVGDRAAGHPILELGCGAGRDTEVLVAAGHDVVALDVAPSQVDAARSRAPSAQIYCQDVRDPFPAATAGVRVVVASLSLHYFVWAETSALVERIRELLSPDGLLLCRLNSSNDVHYGAVGHPEIEKGLYLVDGRPKRFFDRAAVEALFAGWRILGLQEQTVQRYERPKVLWEIVVESVA